MQSVKFADCHIKGLYPGPSLPLSPRNRNLEVGIVALDLQTLYALAADKFFLTCVVLSRSLVVFASALSSVQTSFGECGVTLVV